MLVARPASALALAALLCAPATPAASPAPSLPGAAWVNLSTRELRESYDVLWAVSDLHGGLAQLEDLLLAARLAMRPQGSRTLAWNASARRQLLVAAGDYINGGDSSVQVVLLLKDLQAQAARAGSRIVLLLGNNEAEFLSDPEKEATKELMKSAQAAAPRLKVGDKVKPKELHGSEFGQFLRKMSVGAVVGTWLFAHAGYIDVKVGDKGGAPELRRWAGKLSEGLRSGGEKAYQELLDEKSILAFHNWWRDEGKLAGMRKKLALLGLNGLVIGHDPDALGALGTLAQDRSGWLIKLDTGIKDGASRGRMLRCNVASITTAEGALRMASAPGKPSCQQLTPQGRLAPLTVR